MGFITTIKNGVSNAANATLQTVQNHKGKIGLVTFIACAGISMSLQTYTAYNACNGNDSIFQNYRNIQTAVTTVNWQLIRISFFGVMSLTGAGIAASSIQTPVMVTPTHPQSASTTEK